MEDTQQVESLILNAIQENGKMTVLDLSRCIDVQEQTIRVTLNRMVKKSLVFVIGKQGRFKYYALTNEIQVADKTRKLIDDYMEKRHIDSIDEAIQNLIIRNEILELNSIDVESIDDKTLLNDTLKRMVEVLNKIEDATTRKELGEKIKLILQKIST